MKVSRQLFVLKSMVSGNYVPNGKKYSVFFNTICLNNHFTYSMANFLQPENASFGMERSLLKDISLKRNKIVINVISYYKVYI